MDPRSICRSFRALTLALAALTIAGPAAGQFIELTSQAEVDAFDERFVGTLRVSGGDIVNLDGLSSLEFAEGLYIYTNPLLTDVSGLANLRDVRGTIEFYGNDALADLSVLDDMPRIGRLRVAYNDALTHLSVSGLQQVNTLWVDFNDSLVEIGPFPELQVINQDLWITNNSSLTHVRGLELSAIDGDITIRNNESLVAVELSFPTPVIRSLDIADCPLLTHLDFVSSIEVLDGGLRLDGLGIASLSAFSNLRRVGSHLHLEGLTVSNLQGLENLEDVRELRLRRNSNLESLSGLSGLRNIGEEERYALVEISENPLLSDLSGLSALESVDVLGVTLRNNPSLSDASHLLSPLTTLGYFGLRLEGLAPDFAMNGCEELRVCEGDVVLSGLSDLSGLSSLEETEGLIISHYSGSEWAGFDSLRNVVGHLTITNCDSLESLSGFPSLQQVNGSVSVYRNDRLETLGGFPELSIVGRELTVWGNDSLREVDAFGALRQIGNDSGLWGIFVADNPVLESFRAPAFEQFEGSVVFRRNDALTSIDLGTSIESVLTVDFERNGALRGLEALSSLRTIAGSLRLLANDSLRDIDGLRNVRLITGPATISNNPVLENVSGLAAVESVERVSVQGNEQLSDCCGMASLMSVVTLPQDILEEFPEFPVSFNAPGCNTVPEVVGACGALTAGRDTWCHVYPNPGRDITGIEFNVVRAHPVGLKIYDVTGRLVRSFESETMEPGVHRFEWNGDNEAGKQVPSGVYFARIDDGFETRQARIVRLK